MSQPQRFFFPKLLSRERQTDRLLNAVMSLPTDRAWHVEIKEAKSRRSLSQNAMLWGLIYPEILKQGGNLLGGYHAEDLHDYLLGEWSGWETITAFGKKRMRPIKRSSPLSKSEFSDFVSFIYQRMAEHSIIIPDPDPDYALRREEADEKN